MPLPKQMFGLPSSKMELVISDGIDDEKEAAFQRHKHKTEKRTKGNGLRFGLDAVQEASPALAC